MDIWMIGYLLDIWISFCCGYLDDWISFFVDIWIIFLCGYLDYLIVLDIWIICLLDILMDCENEEFGCYENWKYLDRYHVIGYPHGYRSFMDIIHVH